ncbi:fungal-specific transcription factor domain-containing protein [Gilbertella persicaria]|uniref:fungal-specific transcription factor domain-containing protein n=1 Tax=Gilbertella persicaria TaxID=101096 RepID=UPI00221F90FF|nr:fungal-specific transcription factor domain-containing protein [Gilbertella persicaria]KAI8097944.1 fungal-specific transcription factor domain-containing protein [Gilbertella persicaria]
MRQRLDELENQVSWLTSFAKNLEQDYRATVPRSQTQAYPHSCVVQKPMMDASDELTVACRQETDGPSVYDWAIETGWPVIENADGMKSIFTKITSFEDLNKALRTAVEAIYNTKGNPLYYQPSAKQFDLPSPINQTIPNKRLSITGNETDSGKEHTFTLFESLNRYTTAASGTKNSVDGMGNNFDDHYLETDVMARLIYQHHQCGFPILVSPSRFENHYRQGQLKSLVLSSVFSHAVPHACIYHPHLAQIQQFRELGNRFYNHSHDLLGIDEPANLSNIHQRTLLITYDLDLGRVRRAFLHIGIAIRMCFMLNLHRPEGYVSCKSAFEREQSKRVFWTVWFFDSMVSHLFHDQFSAIKLNQISIELPTPLPEFNQLEMDQTNFAIHLIQVRKIAAILSEESRKLKPRPLVKRLKEKLKRFYRTLPETERFGQINQITFSPGTSVWIRRSYFCVLLDYCQCWITMYRGLLPSANHLGDKPLTEDEQEAILHTSQAAIAIVQLFQAWFRCSEQSGDGFDCFFRPYLYHFMSAKNIFTSNVSQFGRSSPLVNTSRAYLVLLLRLYQTTPTRRSFDESQLEKSFVHFMTTYQIGENEVAYQDIINEALMDEPNADSGWSIFSLHSDPIAKEKLEKDDYLTAPPIPDGVASKCSSNSSIMSEPCTTSDVNFDYF